MLDTAQPVWSVDLRENFLPPSENTDRNENTEQKISNNFSLQGLPALEDIPVSQRLSQNHPLKSFIEKRSALNASDLAILLASSHIDLSISGYHGGAVPAAVPSLHSLKDPHRYDQNTWVRDAALEYFALYRSGQRHRAHQMLLSITEFMGGPEHRDLVTSLHFSENNPSERFANGIGPHCKFSIKPDGKLTWCRTGWAHQQIDAFTSFINTVYRAATLDLEMLSKPFSVIRLDRDLPLDLRKIDPVPDAQDHIIPALIKALHSVKIWNASDVGPWEDFFAHQRATANGLATSMTRECIKFHERHGWDFLNVSYAGRQNPEAFKETVLSLAKNCKSVLDSRIPENGFAIECNRRPHDSAMLLLLYPFRADLSEQQQFSVLRTVYANMGEVGFSRFLATLDYDRSDLSHIHPSELKGEPDLFVGMDYHHNLDPKAYGEFGANVPGFKPAEWSLFDPLLSGYFYRRYIESGGKDTESFYYADRHLKRSLAFIVPEDRELFVAGKGEHGNFIIPKGSLPEAMVWDSKKADFVYNHNNLLMSRAALALAFERAIEAVNLRDSLSQKVIRESA